MRKIKIGLLIALLALVLSFTLERGYFYYNFYFGDGWQSAEDKMTGDYVVLLHGIRASAGAMDNLARHLGNAGYTVINIDYPSSTYNIETLVEEYIVPKFSAIPADENRRLHIVTHSMGGIVLREYLKTHVIKNLGKIVMIAPPNHGSEWSDFFADWKIANWIMGPALNELQMGKNGITEGLPEPTGDIGIIAGKNKWSLIGNILSNGDTDGKVSVESTHLTRMTDFLLVREGHLSILSSKEVMQATEKFLKEGGFNRPSSSNNLSGFARSQWASTLWTREF